MKKLKVFVSCALAAAAHLSAQTVFNPFPSRTIGQPFLQQTGIVTSLAPNLVEGRELWQPQSMAVDNSANPPILYVADTFNNRVLAWKSALGFQKGDFADLVIGQRDLYTTSPQGPGTALTTGLFRPTGVAVDSNGNLYVADAGNNRILRYPKPFAQTTQLLPVDMVLGQPSLTSGAANQGFSTPTEKTLSLSNQLIGLTFDGNGNLWVSDGANNRVLRYPASVLSSPSFGPAADLVLGQPDFVTSTLPKDFTVTSKSNLNQPGALAFGPGGLLFVTDSASDSLATSGRVVVYSPPFTTAESASRIMGVSPLATLAKGAPVPSLTVISQSTFGVPSGIFFIGDSPFIVDTGKSRILQFDPVSNWPVESTTFSPLAQKAYGQSGWELPGSPSDLPNAGQPTSSDSTFALPTSAIIVGSDLLVLDSGNNRVIAIPSFANVTTQAAQFPFFRANRVLGQIDFKYNSVNLIDGREVSFSLGAGSVALDLASSTLHLYVADAANNRVLGFRDARTVQPGQKADIVIGQPDFLTAIRNYPGSIILSGTDACPPGTQTASNLCVPEGVAVDSKGDLWVADTRNGRVLRFPRPFDQPSTSLPAANLVIGQGSFNSKITDPSSQTMSAPYGIAFTANGDLVVSDATLNRVLYFHKGSGTDFVSGQTATNIIGHPDFNTVQSPEPNPLNSPRGIAVDPNFDRLYVADTGNNRILVYRNLPTADRDPAPSIVLGGDQLKAFNGPLGVTVDQFTGEVWVADTSNSRVVRFPSFDTLLTNPASNFTLSSFSPVGLTLDAFGNPIVAEGFNRIGFYYHAIGSGSGNCATCSGNAANYFSRFSPGMLATIKPSTNGSFGSVTATNTQVPVPTTLGDVQVLVGGIPAPLVYVSPNQINFQVPSTLTPGSNLVEFDVVKVSTNQILSAWLFRIESYSPGLFTADASGSGQLLAVNADGSINNSSHRAKAGSAITFYGTGQGVIPGAPPDGTPPSSALTTPILPRVLINPPLEATVTYSGFAPGFIGLWQINAVVPQNVAPGQVLVVVIMNDVPSSLDPVTGKVNQSTIWVTQ